MKRRPRPWLVSVLPVLLLLHCGEGAPPAVDAGVDAPVDVRPSLDAPSTDVADVPAPRDAVRDTPAADAPLIWTRCQRTFFCADLTLPLDPSRPEGQTFTLGLLRARARRPAERVGVLMVNYGGPGSITSEEVAQRYPAVLGDAVGEEIADRYDIVAVDWRGHGRSQPALRCGFVNDGNPSSRPSADPDNDEVWSAYVRSLGEVRASCLTSVPREMLARIGADDMARDMDRVRAVLGEEQITYVGYSYGAYLGAMYLTLFPNRVRAVVLDAPPAPLRTLRQLSLGQARGFQAAWDRFFAWCASDSRCTLAGRDGGAAGVSRAFDALVQSLDRAPLSVGLRRVDGEAAIAVLMSASYAPETQWEVAAAVLAQAASGNGTGLLRYNDLNVSEDRRSSTYFAVRAVDNAADPAETPDTFRAFLRSEIAAIGRHMPRVFGDGVTLVQWPVARAAPLPEIHAPTAPPALLVGSVNDATTPYEGALAMQRALGNGSHLLTYEGGRHAASGRVPCVADVVRAFLETPGAPKVQRCPAVGP
jgi:pimeloyl-ACP methyl ester carboxylesterase